MYSYLLLACLAAKPQLHPELVQALSVNPRPHYRRYVDNWSVLFTQQASRPLQTLHNGFCSKEGVVDGAIQSKVCGMFPLPKRKHGRRIHGTVVVISGKWSHGIWHFPMEFLVGLSQINITHDIIVHLNGYNNYVRQWLDLLHIHHHVQGNIIADTLLIPTLGDCGAPSLKQLWWLKQSIPRSKKSDIVIYIRRRKSRRVQNDKVLLDIIRHSFHRRLRIHDDVNLPSLRDQLMLFSRATLIIAPHGAGLVNIIACRPNTRVIEFMDPANINICYMRLAVLLGLQHTGIPIRSGVVDANALKGALR